MIVSVSTVNKGQNLVRYYRSAISNSLLYEIRNAATLSTFKNYITKCKPNNSPSRM